MKWILFLLALGGLGYFGYERLKTDYLIYPADLRLTDESGRTIEVRLLGRNAAQVEFERVSDGKLFAYPVERLSGFSRIKVGLYPVAMPVEEVTTDSQSRELADMHRDGLVQKLNELRKVYDLLMTKAKSMPSCQERSAVVSQLRKTFYKIRKLEYNLEAFDLRQSPALGTAF